MRPALCHGDASTQQGGHRRRLDRVCGRARPSAPRESRWPRHLRPVLLHDARRKAAGRRPHVRVDAALPAALSTGLDEIEAKAMPVHRDRTGFLCGRSACRRPGNRRLFGWHRLDLPRPPAHLGRSRTGALSPHGSDVRAWIGYSARTVRGLCESDGTQQGVCGIDFLAAAHGSHQCPETRIYRAGRLFMVLLSAACCTSSATNSALE